MHQIYQNSLTLLSDSPYALKLQNLGHLWFIPSYYLEVVDNYNKEKVIFTNRIAPTTVIIETTKMSLLKLLL